MKYARKSWTIAILSLAALVSWAQDARGGKIEWRHDVEQGFMDAARMGIPVMMYFTADW